MAEYAADLRDLKFVLLEQLDLDKLLESERFGDYTREDVEMIVEEAYKFAVEVLGPTNGPADEEGAQFDNGSVTIPEILHGPYKMFTEAGWLSLANSPEYGGQGAPTCLMTATNDLFFGANMAFNLGMLLGTGAAHLIEVFGTDDLRATYVEKMYTGQWGGTMCLTEAQAGSDVGACATKAVKDGDHYLISGEKIFITSGEHNLTENIVHAVLARVEGAVKGTKGLSLFAVPKFRVNADGSLGEFNDVVCSGIEHKLGIHASPTTTLVFGQDEKCHGYLLGEEGGGIRAMFQMMNEARISVGLQGVAQANAAYQAALTFCKERLQGPAIQNMRDPEAPKVPIIQHADVRMMLMRQKAYCEGLRALTLFTTYCDDRAHTEKDPTEQAKFNALLEILTPICKAYCTDMGFRVTEWALQCHGGYGYCNEFPAQQYLRDIKIASIYEGTNGIQAMDLVARKLTIKGGAYLMALMGLVNDFISANKDHEVLKPQFDALAKARNTWGEVNGFFMNAAATKKLMIPLVNATNYLSLCGDLLTAFFLTQQAVIAWDKLQPLCADAGVDPSDARALTELAKNNREVRFYDGKIKTARFFCAYELPAVHSKAAAIQSSDMSAIHMVWDDE